MNCKCEKSFQFSFAKLTCFHFQFAHCKGLIETYLVKVNIKKLNFWVDLMQHILHPFQYNAKKIKLKNLNHVVVQNRKYI